MKTIEELFTWNPNVDKVSMLRCRKCLHLIVRYGGSGEIPDYYCGRNMRPLPSLYIVNCSFFKAKHEND